MSSSSVGKAQWGRVIRAFAEASTAVMLLITASIVWLLNPWLSLIIGLATIDAVDDFSILVIGKSIYPMSVWRIVNPIFELIAFAVAFLIIELAITYVVAFPFPFWYVALALAGFMVYSSFIDIIPKTSRSNWGGWV